MRFTRNIKEIKSARLPILFSAAVLLTTSGCSNGGMQYMDRQSSTLQRTGNQKLTHNNFNSNRDARLIWQEIDKKNPNQDKICQYLDRFATFLKDDFLNEFFLSAAEKGLVKVLEKLLMISKVNLEEARDDSDFNALTLAAAGGHQKAVGLLINKGFDITGDNGFLSLLLAVANEHTEVVKVLERQGADLKNLVNFSKSSFLSLKPGYLGTLGQIGKNLEKVLESTEPKSILKTSIKYKKQHLESVKRNRLIQDYLLKLRNIVYILNLLPNSIDPNEANKDGSTFLNLSELTNLLEDENNLKSYDNKCIQKIISLIKRLY